ncbi:hypothetical protein [Ensifer adhaerens]|uniref:hypothetical protein n=1 Tax=Ensifer adhaerens TaxID=106592 RepID=UPI0015699761|nr:hypothetical protein [Ensifer adhaerens]
MVTVLVQPLTEAEKRHRELLLQSDEFKDLYPHRRQKTEGDETEGKTETPTFDDRSEEKSLPSR